MSSTTTRSVYDEGVTLQGESKRIYTVMEKISAGGYGAVYKVKDERGGGTYALKEELREQNRNHYKLFMEVQVLQAALKVDQMKRKHFPLLIDKKQSPDRMFIVMTLLGESLADLKRRKPERVFSPNTGYYCAVETLEAIRDLHELGFVHRDIKPANFVIGQRRKQNNNVVFMVDFGIAREFMGRDGQIKTPRPRTKFKGTVRFAPMATHKQQEIGRKDDCESWAYMVVDLLDRNRLPWQEVEDRRRVEEMKVAALANPKMLFPEEEQKEMASIISYLNGQHYVDHLDYQWIRTQVQRVALRHGCQLDPPYDWNLPSNRTL